KIAQENNGRGPWKGNPVIFFLRAVNKPHQTLHQTHKHNSQLSAQLSLSFLTNPQPQAHPLLPRREEQKKKVGRKRRQTLREKKGKGGRGKRKRKKKK